MALSLLLINLWCLLLLIWCFLQGDAVVVLPDIRPAAAVHLLVLPRAHVPNVSSLAGPDVALGEMVVLSGTWGISRSAAAGLQGLGVHWVAAL